MQKSRDYSFGYDYNAIHQITRRLPQRAIPVAAPAGAINSSARDMAQWVRLMLGNGVIDGRRLVSEKGFDELDAEANEDRRNVLITVSVGFCGSGMVTRLSSTAATSTVSTRKSH